MAMIVGLGGGEGEGGGGGSQPPECGIQSSHVGERGW